MSIVKYDGKSYVLTPIEPSEWVSCEQCDLLKLECAEIDPDWLCYAEVNGKVQVFKEIPLINEK